MIRVYVGGDVRDYLIEKTGGKQMIEVLYPNPARTVFPAPTLSPDCEIGRVLVDIFGAYPRPG